MSATHKYIPPRSTLPFVELAAWISFFIAILLAATIGAQYALELFGGEELFAVEKLWFLGLVTSVIFGVISLLGFRQHRRKFTLWIALTGVLVGGGLVVAEVVFFFILLAGFGYQ